VLAYRVTTPLAGRLPTNPNSIGCTVSEVDLSRALGVDLSPIRGPVLGAVMFFIRGDGTYVVIHSDKEVYRWNGSDVVVAAP
jgi:hypothetical protein